MITKVLVIKKDNKFVLRFQEVLRKNKNNIIWRKKIETNFK